MFKTSELPLIASLVFLGYDTQGLEVADQTKKRVYFLFEDTNQLRIDIENYWQKRLMVEPLRYNMIIRQLKSQIYNA